MPLDRSRCALASGGAFAVLWVICSLVVWLLPGPIMWITGHMMHADFAGASWHLTFLGFIVGLVGWFVLAGAAGWLIAAFYNRLTGAAAHEE